MQLMAEKESHFYEFGRFRLDAVQRVLLRDGELVPLTPKVFEILQTLVEHGGDLVQKNDLMTRVWPDTFVEEGNLTQNVSVLRKALGEGPNGPRYIETIPRRGYRFAVPVVEADETRSQPRQRATNGHSLVPPDGNRISIAPESAPVEGFESDSNVLSSDRDIEVGTATVHRPFGRLKFPILVFGTLALALLVAGTIYFSRFAKAGTATGSPIESIAVLPFVDDASDADSQYLDDKIADSLINSLSKLPKLRVVPRSVVANLKDASSDPRKIGRDLNVRAVVTGRVHRHGDTITIQADLIDLDNVSQIWGQLYDRKLSDILLVQEDISRDIFENLRLKLNVDEQKQLEAYRLYLKGRNSWNKRTEEGLEQGIETFQQALAIDANYAPAYAGLADCYNMQVVYGSRQPADGFPKAKEAAVRALEIDEHIAEAHSSLAFIKFRWDRDRVAAEREFQEAIRLKPSYAPAHQWYSSFLVALERFDEAIAEAKRTQELEPLSFTASSHLGWIYYLSGQDDQAIEQCTRILTLDPNSFPALRYRGLAYQQKGMYKEAIADFQKGLKLSGSPLVLALLGHAYAASGKKAEARQVLIDLQELPNQRYVSPYTVGAIYAGLGDKDKTFAWLEKAFEESDIWMMNLKVDPVFANIRQDKRFTDLLGRAGLRP